MRINLGHSAWTQRLHVMHTRLRLHTPACTPMQLAVGAEIVRKDGVGALYKGLSAGLLRQATYTTTRLGIFNMMSEELKARNNGQVGTRRKL